MSIDYRGFRVTTDVSPDDTGMQWRYSAKIDPVDDNYRDAKLPPVEGTVSRLKIDVLMVMSMVEQLAKDMIEEWHKKQ
ncbi:hypothetical protein [Burkholderia gladioli]|uniref:hypothetical protein n=1 Tax=Burkholderia gladioli TaxID=28095 RepID=UPI000CFF6FA9|nr:hypothetical protein [Burkholderia gladioli]PRG58789.1 hypothetical protein C6V06_00225 [Burkholderia gladioli]